MTGISIPGQVNREEAALRFREHVMGILALGQPIAYEDPEHDGQTVREYPDGRRMTIRTGVDGSLVEGREIPPKDHMDPAFLAEKLSRTCWTSYCDPEYPGVVVREYPDGRRIIVHPTAGGGTVTLTEGCEIPPRKDRNRS